MDTKVKKGKRTKKALKNRALHSSDISDKIIHNGFYLFSRTPQYVEDLLLNAYQTPTPLSGGNGAELQIVRAFKSQGTIHHEAANLDYSVFEFTGRTAPLPQIHLQNFVLTDTFGLRVQFTQPHSGFEFFAPSSPDNVLQFFTLDGLALVPSFSMNTKPLCERAS